MTTEHLYNSAIQCKSDPIKGVTENIVMGTQAPIGTGIFKICYDDQVKKSTTNLKDVNGKQTSRSPNKKMRIREQGSEPLIFDGIN